MLNSLASGSGCGAALRGAQVAMRTTGNGILLLRHLQGSSAAHGTQPLHHAFALRCDVSGDFDPGRKGIPDGDHARSL